MNMENNSANPNTIQLEARLFNGFADCSRLAILKSLIDKEKSVSEVVEIAGLSQPNVSAHLSCLKECGLVQLRQDGRQVIYSLADEKIAELIILGQSILKHTANTILACTRY